MNWSRFASCDSVEWDRFVLLSSVNGTFLHTRKYISYHEDRFTDFSYICRNSSNNVVAVFPAALCLTDPTVVISHPGISFAGVILSKSICGQKCIELLASLFALLKSKAKSKVIYKVVPDIFKPRFFQDEKYALYRLGASCHRVDLSTAIDLSNRGKLTKGRKSDLSKASRFNIELSAGSMELPIFFGMLSKNLKDKYNTVPTHTLQELELLQTRFLNEIECVVARLDGVPLASTVLFHHPYCTHTQYLCSAPEAEQFRALDYLIEYSIQKARQSNKRFFSFGVSTEQEGNLLNEPLYRFKRSFGADGVIHEFYTIDLVNYADF